MDDKSMKIARAFEGNERVYFHPHDATIAVWYGDTVIRIFDSQSWEEVGKRIVKAIPEAVAVELAKEGFERKGRCTDDWRLVK